MEKQRDKAERRLQRKAEKRTGEGTETGDAAETGEPPEVDSVDAGTAESGPTEGAAQL